MLEFKSIRYKNFQSAGNQGINVILNRTMTTLVGGHNGAGKSTLLEAISYALFGKPLKKIVLGGLVNTINRKSMEVEIAFSKNGIDYRIVRGQKPAKLEFYIGDDLVDQSAAAKDYQAKIEYVLGMDYKLFTQIVVLNKEKYVPFMDLDAASRRKVVEDILDISIFGVMSDIIKEESKVQSVELNDTTYHRNQMLERLVGKRRLLDEANNNLNSRLGDVEDQIKTAELSIADHNRSIMQCEDELETLKDYATKLSDLNKRKLEFEKVSQAFKQSISTNESTIKFFDTNETCPTCKGEISEDVKKEHIDTCNKKLSDIRESSRKMVDMYQSLMSDIAIQQARSDQSAVLHTAIRDHRNAISQLERDINSHRARISQINESSRVDDIQRECDEVEAELVTLTEALNRLIADGEMYKDCKNLLKDDGIKASVVRDYIEFINSRVNEYLNSMEFYLNITLDENFSESINSVNREGFTYDNLSTGQKTRVNLAVWLALLEVASLKNSVVTNILFLDEILENLDSEGVSMFMRLVKEKLPHKNTFVVTQRFDEFKDYFMSDIRFKLCDGFTEIV